MALVLGHTVALSENVLYLVQTSFILTNIEVEKSGQS
jgi:hypothetical protein